MKKRDIILDFTSLLDVTLIIIFFFVIFSRLESDETRQQLETKMQELSQAVEQAEAREQEANEMLELLEKDIEFVREGSPRQASNLVEILNYGKSGNVKAILVKKDDMWYLRIICHETLVSDCLVDSIGADEVIEALTTIGYSELDTILCDFVYDGSQPGTATAYRKVKDALQIVKKSFSCLYYSETDISIGED